MLFDPDFISVLGPERESLVLNAVGMFRLNYSSPSPSPYAADVYERVKDHPLFQHAWQQRLVASELASSETSVRIHSTLGRLDVYAVDFLTAKHGDLFVRVLVPSNKTTAAKFERLEQIGKEQAASRGSDLIVCG
jgi:Fe-S cluster assembly scaffold protein SufB